MALIKCSECGHDVSDKAETCAYCGCPVSVTLQVLEAKVQENAKMKARQQQEADAANAERRERFQKNKKKNTILGCVLSVLVIAVIIAALMLTKDLRTYQAGVRAMEKGDYTLAAEQFSKVPDYRDAAQKGEQSQHLLLVAYDKDAPVISGIPSDSSVEVEYDSSFNLLDYLKENLDITDEVSGRIDTFLVLPVSDNALEVYHEEDGSFRTDVGGRFDFLISAADEAGNEASCPVEIFIDDTIYVNAGDEFPKVIYQGKYGTITLDSIEESKPYYNTGYCFYATLSFENGSEHRLQTWMRNAYFNGIKTNMYHPLANSIDPGKKGSTYSYIDEDEMTEEMKPFEYFEAAFQIADEDNDVIFERPIRIDVGVIQNYNPPA